MAFVANVHADEQGCDLLDDSRVFEFAAIERADAGNLSGELACELGGVGIVAAHDDVAIEWSVSDKQVGRNVMEGGHYAHLVGHKFGSLLCGGALPDAKSARGASADAGCEWHSGVNQDATGGDGRLQFLEKSGLSFKRDRQHKDVRGSTGGAVLHARDIALASESLLDRGGSPLSAVCFSRANDDGFSSAG